MQESRCGGRLSHAGRQSRSQFGEDLTMVGEALETFFGGAAVSAGTDADLRPHLLSEGRPPTALVMLGKVHDTRIHRPAWLVSEYPSGCYINRKYRGRHAFHKINEIGLEQPVEQ